MIFMGVRRQGHPLSCRRLVRPALDGAGLGGGPPDTLTSRVGQSSEPPHPLLGRGALPRQGVEEVPQHGRGDVPSCVDARLTGGVEHGPERPQLEDHDGAPVSFHPPGGSGADVVLAGSEVDDLVAGVLGGLGVAHGDVPSGIRRPRPVRGLSLIPARLWASRVLSGVAEGHREATVPSGVGAPGGFALDSARDAYDHRGIARERRTVVRQPNSQ